MEKEVREAKAALDARSVELRTRTADAAASEQNLRDMEKALHGAQACYEYHIIVIDHGNSMVGGF